MERRQQNKGPDSEEMKHVNAQIRNVVGFRPLPNPDAPYAPVQKLINHPYVVEHPEPTIIHKDGNVFYAAKSWHDPVGTVWGYMNQPPRILKQGNVDTKIVGTGKQQRLYWYATQTIPANTELLWYYGDQYNMPYSDDQGAAAQDPRAVHPSTFPPSDPWEALGSGGFLGSSGSEGSDDSDSDDDNAGEALGDFFQGFSGSSGSEGSDDSNDNKGVPGGIDRGFHEMSLRF